MIMREQNAVIAIDEAKFKKTTKKLFQQLQEFENSKNLKLSDTQEILSKALGFRNFHDLQQLFFNPKLVKKEIRWEQFTEENFVKLLFLLPSDNASMWVSRALVMIYVVVSIVFLRFQKGEIKRITISDFRETMRIENLVEFANRKDIPQETKTRLDSYLLSLPTFRFGSTLNDTILEQHGYLVMMITHRFDFLERAEVNNVVLFDLAWFDLKWLNENDFNNFKYGVNDFRGDILDVFPGYYPFYSLWMDESIFRQCVLILVEKRGASKIHLSDVLDLFSNFALAGDAENFIEKIGKNYSSIIKISEKMQSV